MYFWILSGQTLSLFSKSILQLHTRIVFVKFHDYFIFFAIFIQFLNPQAVTTSGAMAILPLLG